MTSNKSLSCDSKVFAKLSADLLQAGRTLRFTAIGSSMTPLIRNGDILSVDPVIPEHIKIGDVLFFTCQTGRALVHRVIQKQISEETLCFVMQGDQADRPDGCVPASRIFGRVSRITRNNKHIDMNRAPMKQMGRLASFYLRQKPPHKKRLSWAYQLLKQMPVIKKYLT